MTTRTVSQEDRQDLKSYTTEFPLPENFLPHSAENGSFGLTAGPSIFRLLLSAQAHLTLASLDSDNGPQGLPW